MANILPFPVQNLFPVWGLSEPECDAIQTKAYELMVQGYVTGVSIHSHGPYMCVLDDAGYPYSLSRENGMCLLSNSSRTMVARSRRLENVLEALEILLTSGMAGAA